MSNKKYTKDEVLALMQKALNLGRRGRLFCDHLLEDNDDVKENNNIAKGGVCKGSVTVYVKLKGAERILPTISTGDHPYDNDKYMFQND